MTTHRCAVLGSPVAHSLSPTLHAAGYAARDLTGWEYTRHEVDEGGLPPFVAGLDHSWRGLSLTMPLKAVALEVAESVSDLAREAGAVNTLVRTGTGWAGHNTDVAGIVTALREAGAGRPRSATVIGSGATARSTLLALRELGAEQVVVAARNPDRGKALAESVAGQAATVVDLTTWPDRPADVVVSTLPGGDAGLAAAGPLAEHDGGLSGTVLLDVVYADWPTPLARAAAEQGADVVSGLEMLVHQAAEQFALFTGHRPPVAAMHAAGLTALGHTPDA